MGAFQANILEAMKNLCEDLQKSLQKSKQVEVDQTSASASKQNPSHSKNLDPSKTSTVELMNVDYGPALPPHLVSYDSRVDDASGHQLSSVEEPSRVVSTRAKSHLILTSKLTWCRALPRTTVLNPRMTLSLPRADLRNTLTNPNIIRGPDSYPHLQRRISPLNVDIGLLSLLGSPALIRTIHNMTLTPLITGK